jgi:hypothetical protein
MKRKFLNITISSTFTNLYLVMDSKFNTQFYSWIRNENNVDYISFYLRRVIVDFEQHDFLAIQRAIKWLVDGWSVPRIAELLIKLFYHWGIQNEKFAKLVSEITKSWPIVPHTVDLVVTLVIGERSSKTAKFTRYFTQDWEPSAIVDLVSRVGTRLGWTERYFKHFIIQYLNLTHQNHPWPNHLPEDTTHIIKQKFQAWKNLKRDQWNTNDLSDNFPSLVHFSSWILGLMLSLEYPPKQAQNHPPSLQ